MSKIIGAEGLLYTRRWLKPSLPKRTANFTPHLSEDTKILLNQIEENSVKKVKTMGMHLLSPKRTSCQPESAIVPINFSKKILFPLKV
jgi:hypothetical protein